MNIIHLIQKKHRQNNILHNSHSQLVSHRSDEPSRPKCAFTCILLICCTFLYSCTSDITKNYNTFKDLCESSGGQVIEGGSCKCPRDGACTKGVTCINGVCANNVCSATEEGNTRCTNDDNNVGQMQKCQNNQWIPDNPPSCDDGSSCNIEGKCGKCQNDEIKCDESSGKAMRKQCTDGEWKDQVECRNVSCSLYKDKLDKDKTDCGECQNGDARCFGNGTIQKCDDGKWKDVATCDPAECMDNNITKCVDDTCSNLINIDSKDRKCVECKSGTLKCEPTDPNAKYYKCIRGQWTGDDKWICDTNECNEDKSRCKKLKCTENYTECRDGNLEICEIGKEMKYSPCVPAADCKNDTECGECKNNATKCEHYKLYTCNNAVWATEPTTECHCKDAVNCESCSAEVDTRCIIDAQETCISMGEKLVWSAPKACENGQTCKDGKCAESNTDVPCTLNTLNRKQCTSETEFKTCDENGHWVTASCDWGKKCVDGECKECESGQKCINNVMNVCQDYKWEPQKDLCGYGCKEGTSECYDCDPSKTVVCNNKKLAKCNNGTLGDTVHTCQNCIVNNNGEDDYCNECQDKEKPWVEEGNVCICNGDRKKQCEKKLCYNNEVCSLKSNDYECKSALCIKGTLYYCDTSKIKKTKESLCINNKILSCENENEKPGDPRKDTCTPSQQEKCPDEKCNCKNDDIICENKMMSTDKTTGVHYRCEEGQWKEFVYCITNIHTESTCNSAPDEILTSGSTHRCSCDTVCKIEVSLKEASLKFYKCTDGEFVAADNAADNDHSYGTTIGKILNIFPNEKVIPNCSDLEKYFELEDD